MTRRVNSAYDISDWGQVAPIKKGELTSNGFISFLPDRQGAGVVKVYGESDYGMHGAQIEIKVMEGLFMDFFRKPLVAQYTKALWG